MDTIRDMLSVGEYGDGQWAIWNWESYDSRLVATFPREDEAWGVTSLILEYVEKHLYDPQAAIWAALDGYHQALGDERALGNEPAPADAAYQDHAHAMEVVAYPN